MIPTDILNYRVVRHIGTGGMGSVYLAVNTSIDQQVAIKVLRPEVAANPRLRARFKQEAELLCSLDHPNIVKFLNYVETPQGVYLIMEYVKGITLKDFINKKNGLIVEKKAYPIISEILDAFEYAHSKGIVHRDIKPSNIIIQDDGHIKVMDFGIAQIVSESNGDGNTVMGTPAYMSPEQIYGKPVDARSDIYSLGVLIYNMLTGRAPYDSTLLTEQEIKRKVVNDNMPRMAEIYPYISDKMQAVVDKATQKIPEARYQSCSEMKAAVKKAINPDPIPKPLLYGGIAAILILLIGGFLTWDYFRTKVDYYKDYVEVYGVPEGIGSLSNREMSHRAASYRFEYTRHKLRRVSYVNSKGKLVDHHETEDVDRIVDMTLTYTEGTGKIDAAKYMDRSGKVLYVKDYDSNFKTCTFKLDDELGTEMTLTGKTELFQSAFNVNSNGGKGKISKYILEYDDKGYLTKVEYAGFGNVRVPNGEGIFGKRYVNDEKGRVIEEHYLGKDGKPKSTSFGLGIKRFTYDDDDNVVKFEYLTAEGKPSSDGNNCPVVLLTYDKWGNRQTERYTDAKGNPMVRTDITLAGLNYEYNDDGTERRRTYIGIDGGYAYYKGVAGQISEYDENGYVTKITYVDDKNKAAYYSEDPENDESAITYSSIVVKNDDKGNPLEVKYLNAEGKLSESMPNAWTISTYDSIGNQLSMYYLDDKGKPTISTIYGYAGYELTYNAQGRIEKLIYMDQNKHFMNDPKVHWCYFKKSYDARGNVVKMEFFDKENKPVLSNEGIAAVEYEYDENGNEVSRQFLGTKGNACTLNGSCSRFEFAYDDQGNEISDRYKNTEGKLMLVDGVAGHDWKYDSRGNQISDKPIGISGGLASGKLETRQQFDIQNNLVQVAYYGNGGSAALNAEGFHKAVMKYNGGNLCIETEYFGTDGKLKNIAGNNYAIIKKEYDDRRNVTSQTFFTQTGQRGNDASKVHKYYNQYDPVINKVCHQLSFGPDGKPVAANGIAPEGRIKYDKRGNSICLACYDGYGKKSNGLHGWCELRTTYNDAGLTTSESYFSLDGKAAMDKDAGYHKVVYTYNSMRQRDSESYFGNDDKPLTTAGGYSVVKIKWNNQNQFTERSYFGSGNKKVNTKAGWQKEIYTYKNGSPSTCVLYDASGRKLASAVWNNGEWTIKGVGQKAASQNNNMPSWRAIWLASAKECPMKVADGIILSHISVSSTTVVVDFKFESLSGSDITSNYMDGLENVKTYLIRRTQTPSYVVVQVNVYDQNGEKVATL